MTISRRPLLLGALGALAAPPLVRAQGSSTAWTRDAYLAAMRASGRETTITEANFNAIQARKPAALRRIESYLKARFNGEADPAVMRAFEALPREYFHWNYEGRSNQAGVTPTRTTRSPGASATARRCRTIWARPT